MKLTCAHCRHEWQEDDDEARKTIKAAKSNGQGPWCNLCHHLKFADIFATHRKHPAVAAIRKILNQIAA